MYNTSHNYSTGGIYTITIYVIDENNASSETQSLKVMVNTKKIGSLGYLIDKDGDGLYDVFYRETTDRETLIEKNYDEYNIDINNDTKWDYTYSLITNNITIYKATIQNSETKLIIEDFWILIIGFICIITFFVILFVFRNKSKNTRRPKKVKKTKKKTYKYKKKKTKKTKHVEIPIEEIRDIEKEVVKIKKEKK
jgi:ATP-dependent Zn protease